MSRAELRREQREKKKDNKTYNLTAKELEQLEQRIRKEEQQKAKQIILDKTNILAEQILTMMLVIPTNVLVSDYWQKSAKKRAPKFIEDVMSLYEAVEKGVVSEKQLADLLYELAGIKIEAEWINVEK